MIERELHRRVTRAARRCRLHALVCGLTWVWLLTAAVIGLAAAARLPRSSWLIAAAVSAGGAVIVVRSQWPLRRREAARRIEAVFPELNQRLLAALEQQPDAATGRFGFLQAQVIHQALEHARAHEWGEIVSRRKFAVAGTLHGGALVVLTAAVLWGTQATARRPNDAPGGAPLPASLPAVDYRLSVEPGNTEVERGTPLLVLARFEGALPGEVGLELVGGDGRVTHLAMTKSLDDPLFAGRMERVDEPLRYRVVFDGRTSDEFAVSVFDVPQLERADALVTFPEYTGLPAAELKDVRRLSVVEGSSVRLICRTNKAIAAARLVPEDGQPILFSPSGEDERLLEAHVQPGQSVTFHLEMADADGRQNRFPPEFAIEVLPNRRPELHLVFPARDLQVSPLEELVLQASASDDFGLKQAGIVYALTGANEHTLVLAREVPGRESRPLEHLLALEDLAAEPDQLVSYYFFADDLGPDGRPRRTFSDMYFAEVRHFEEVFREGQAPAGGSAQAGGSGPQSESIEKLISQQKEVVSATWTLVRRETAPGPSAAFAEDVALVRDSQGVVRQRVEELGAELRDARSKVFLAGAVQEMLRAEQRLETATAAENAESLPAALASEQAAYQGLLKLRAREHQVAQSQSSGGGGEGGGSRSEQQLQQLELSSRQNRYESEKQAGSQPPSTAAREQLQVLNRLRELSRRQQDLNEKLKELENQLHAARSEGQREELRRRLKQLREQQQEMVRDVDELRQRMDRPENQIQMAEARRQLDQTRERVRQTSEALQAGRLSQALNSGTRAERELTQLRDDFRRRTAGQFTDAVRELRRQARELSRRETELADGIRQALQEARPSLRYAEQRRQLGEGLRRQKQSLEELFEQIRRVVEQSEQSEPLLSRQLYEAVRDARASQPAENLEGAAALVARGLLPQAEQAEQQARRGIETIRQGIEKAAESVLGDETEALARAREELQQLAEALKAELDSAIDRSAGAGQAGGALSGRGPIQTADRTQPQPADAHPPQEHRPAGAGAHPSDADRFGPQDDAGTPGQAAGLDAPGGEQPGGQPQRPGLRGDRNSPASSVIQTSSVEGGESGGPGGPLTGESFRDWSDRMRDVEEMLDDPQLKADVAQLRDRARSLRAEFKRHSQEPNWELVRATILEPMVELESRLAEELLRRTDPESLVPIDRDPVPRRFADMVRRYYERLGTGE